MAKKGTKKVKDAGFVPGIYNYCDRWCEKCNQQLHCMTFVLGRKIEEKGVFRTGKQPLREGETIWERLKKILDTTYEVLHEIARSRGMKIDDLYAMENIEKEFMGEVCGNDFDDIALDDKVERNDIVLMSVIYENEAEKCLEKIYGSMEDVKKGNDLAPVDESMEVINWYVDIIQAKMRRAFYKYYYQTAPGHVDDGDYNGSAKVAILSIDRSIAGWKVIREYFPACRREIAHLLLILEQLLWEVEECFPDARTFLRPGFEKTVAYF